MCRSERARFTQALNCPFDPYMAHASGFAIPDLVQGLRAGLVELEPARSSRSDQLTTRRNVQSGNLTRLERQLEDRAAGGDLGCRREFEVSAPFDVIESTITQDNSRTFH